MALASPLCTFGVHDLLLGVEVTRVREVVRHQPLTPVPLVHATIAGLMNLRGQIVTVIDLRRRLGLPPRADDEPPLHVVMHDTDGVVSLLVDRIGDVIEVNEAAFERPPQTSSAAARELIRGAYALEGQLLLVLDAARALELGEAVH
ncbi:MAG TPA: chemotaxis protein CheW [Polyangiaceae bacterium]|nr:chemotaxis protein CheW [Polyangiaceae bacterium]